MPTIARETAKMLSLCPSDTVRNGSGPAETAKRAKGTSIGLLLPSLEIPSRCYVPISGDPSDLLVKVMDFLLDILATLE